MNVAVIGGDRRMLYAAECFRSHGYTVCTAGLGQRGDKALTVEEAASGSDILVLPVRPAVQGYLFAPLYEERIPVHRLAGCAGEKPIFCGVPELLGGAFSGRVCNYGAREDFLIRNAVLTAECAVGELIRETEDAVFGAEITVIGYGRIGRILARYLKQLGARVTVSARRREMREWARAEGCGACDHAVDGVGGADILINTVPAPVADAAVIDTLHRDTLLVDLASSPGGIDYDRAAARGLRCIRAIGLPGKIAPKAAGRVIEETVCQMIKEENGGKDNPGLCDDRLFLHL